MEETTSDWRSGTAERLSPVDIPGYGGLTSSGAVVGPLPTAPLPLLAAARLRCGSACYRATSRAVSASPCPVLLAGCARSSERRRSGRAVRRIKQYQAVDRRQLGWVNSVSRPRVNRVSAHSVSPRTRQPWRWLGHVEDEHLVERGRGDVGEARRATPTKAILAASAPAPPTCTSVRSDRPAKVENTLAHRLVCRRWCNTCVTSEYT